MWKRSQKGMNWRGYITLQEMKLFCVGGIFSLDRVPFNEFSLPVLII